MKEAMIIKWNGKKEKVEERKEQRIERFDIYIYIRVALDAKT